MLPGPMLPLPLLYTLQDSMMAGSILHRKTGQPEWPLPMEAGGPSPAEARLCQLARWHQSWLPDAALILKLPASPAAVQSCTRTCRSQHGP